MNQRKRVLEYMQTFGSISSLEAFRDLGVTRLAAQIFDLKEEGFPIGSDWEESENRYGEKVRFKRYRILTDEAEKVC